MTMKSVIFHERSKYSSSPTLLKRCGKRGIQNLHRLLDNTPHSGLSRRSSKSFVTRSQQSLENLSLRTWVEKKYSTNLCRKPPQFWLSQGSLYYDISEKHQNRFPLFSKSSMWKTSSHAFVRARTRCSFGFISNPNLSTK